MGGPDKVEGNALWGTPQVNFPERCGNSRMKDHISKGPKLLKREETVSGPG